MTYALGRGVEPSDMPVVRRIVTQGGARATIVSHSIVQGIIDSAPFQMRTKLDPAGPSTTVARATATGLRGVAMIITKKHLSRRTFLQGSARRRRGAAVPRRDGAGADGAVADRGRRAPFRFGVIYMPCGVYPETWHPTQDGANFEFKPVMQPRRAVPRSAGDDQQDEGARGASRCTSGASSAFLNGVGPDISRAGTGDAFNQLRSKKTLDQYIADKVAGDTPMRSIEVGTEDMGTAAGACDGFPCTMFETLAWREDTRPLPVSINPRVTFERMFGETGSQSVPPGAAQGKAEPARLDDGGNVEAARARSARPTRRSSTSI